MGYDLREMDPPARISSGARELMDAAEGAGFVELGWLEFSASSVIPMVEYARPDGTTALSVMGQIADGGFEPLNMDCVSRLEDGREVTSGTIGFVMSRPDLGIHKFSHTGATVAELYGRHLEHLEELDGIPKKWATTLEEVAGEIRKSLDKEGFFKDAEETEDPWPTLIGRSGDFTLITGPIRPDAKQVHVYSEGLVVFLYDESREDAIRDANPEVLWGVGRGTLEDRATRELLESGDLLVYAQPGDGGVDAEIVVGSDLTAEEKEPGIWDPPEVGWIRLPTGRLCIHSYNTIPMGDNGDEPPDEGAVVDVSPGNYRVTLHRKNFWTMSEEGIADLEEAEEAGIDVFDGEMVEEVIVLTPMAEGGDRPERTNFLFPDCVGL